MAAKAPAAAASRVTGGRSVALRVLFALLRGVLPGLAVAGPVAAQFSAQPVIIELEAGATPATAVITVRNESAAPLQLRVYASDFDQPAAGGHVFMEPGSHARSCADRLVFVPGNLVLEPHGAGEVRVRMEPGDSTCWSLVFIQSVARDAAGIRVAQRIGVKVYGVSGGLRADGEIRDVRVGLDEGGSREIELAFANTGAGPVRPKGEVEVRSEAGDVVAVIPVRPFSVLPGRVARTRVPVDVTLGPGTYLLVPILDFGGEYLAGGQALLEIRAP